MKGMILAAGLGTRFKPWTDQHPKALALVNGKTLLQRNVEYLQKAGVDDVVVNVHHFADQIESAIQKHNGWGSTIQISDERDVVLETGGGLLKAAPLLGEEPFVLINVDVLTDLKLTELIKDHQENTPLATLAVTRRVTSRYLLFDHDRRLSGWKNTATGEEKIARPVVASPYAFSGIHVIDPAIFNYDELRGKFSMIDLYLSLAKDQEIRGFDHSNSAFIDVGRPESVPLAENLFP